jgi:hypothetical protein
MTSVPAATLANDEKAAEYAEDARGKGAGIHLAMGSRRLNSNVSCQPTYVSASQDFSYPST